MIFLFAIIYKLFSKSDSMSSDTRIILKKILNMDENHLSAEGKSCRLDVLCDNVGTSISYSLGNVQSSVIIAKGSLASIGFTKSSQPLWLVFCVIFAFFGVIGIMSEIPTEGLGMLIISAVLYIMYYFSKMSVLQFDSSGAKTYSFQFSGVAANRSSDVAQFCRAAIMNDLSLPNEGNITPPPF